MMTLCSSSGSRILVSDSVGRSELESCKWRSSFPKYSLSLRVQITLFENPLIAHNAKGDESHLYRFPTDQLCRLQGLSGLQSLTHCTNSSSQRPSSTRSKPRLQGEIQAVATSVEVEFLETTTNTGGRKSCASWHVESLCNGAREIAMPDRG